MSFRIRSLEAERRTLLGRADSLSAECSRRKTRESGKSNGVAVVLFLSLSSPETNFLVGAHQKMHLGIQIQYIYIFGARYHRKIGLLKEILQSLFG